MAAPSVHRRALLTWLGVFPVITLVQWIIGSHVAHWPLVARTFVVTALAVPMAVYFVVPAINRVAAHRTRTRP